MTKFKIKSGDTVKVIAGDHKGSEGKVLQILRDKNRAIVEGVNMSFKAHKTKRSKSTRRNCKERSFIHISNLC